MSSAVDSQFMDSDDYAYEEHKQHIDEINRLEDDSSPKTPGAFGSALHIPKFKMIGGQQLEEEKSPGHFMEKRKQRDYSPMTPSKTKVVRTGFNHDKQALLNSPKVSSFSGAATSETNHLPMIKSPVSKGLNKSTFSKKPEILKYPTSKTAAL